MAIPKAGRGHPLAVLALHLAVVGALTMVNAQATLPPPQLQLLATTTTAGSVPSTAVITIAVIAFFVLVLFCVLVDLWRRSSAVTDDASAGGWQGSIRRHRTRGLDPAALAALPVVPYAQIRKHKSGGGLECAVCLTAFDDGDELRLLPQCSHAFHPECINPWLEGHVTCPLCRANLEKPVPPPTESPLPSPEKEPPQTPEAISVRVDAEDGEERKEEAVELEKLRCARRAARMPRSRSISATAAAETGDHERFTVRLPPHVREEVLRSRRLRHATSLVITLGGGGASDCPGSSTACSAGGERCVRRRWASLLSRTASWSWAQGGGEASSGKKGVGPEAGGTRRPPCGHVVCSLAARWPARCKAKISP
jgi:E3 ubiquitin-protein ligase ATL6/9/15/31/42/55